MNVYKEFMHKICSRAGAAGTVFLSLSHRAPLHLHNSASLWHIRAGFVVKNAVFTFPDHFFLFISRDLMQNIGLKKEKITYSALPCRETQTELCQGRHPRIIPGKHEV